MEIKATSKYSNIYITDDCGDLKQFLMLNKKIIHFIAEPDSAFIVVEYIPSENLELYVSENIQSDKEAPFDSFPRKTQEQMELETALDTVLNNDPRGKYNGCNLRVPFDCGDFEWVEWVLANMHNKFIKDKVKLIKESGYGKN